MGGPAVTSEQQEQKSRIEVLERPVTELRLRQAAAAQGGAITLSNPAGNEPQGQQIQPRDWTFGTELPR
jgi:hypothetical protein